MKPILSKTKGAHEKPDRVWFFRQKTRPGLVFGSQKLRRLRGGSAAVGGRFRTQRLFADRTDERLVLRGDHDHSALGHRVTPAILIRVVANERAARNEHVAIDDGAADP